MERERQYAHVLDRLRAAGLRPTRRRLALAKLLFDSEDRHVTAEMLHGEAVAGPRQRVAGDRLQHAPSIYECRAIA